MNFNSNSINDIWGIGKGKESMKETTPSCKGQPLRNEKYHTTELQKTCSIHILDGIIIRLLWEFGKGGEKTNLFT